MNQETDQYKALAVELYYYVRDYVPKGWKEPIHVVDFCPIFIDKDVVEIEKHYRDGSLDDYLKSHDNKNCGRGYVAAAIKEFCDEKFSSVEDAVK